jgi:hypothetical protein
MQLFCSGYVAIIPHLFHFGRFFFSLFFRLSTNFACIYNQGRPVRKAKPWLSSVHISLLPLLFSPANQIFTYQRVFTVSASSRSLLSCRSNAFVASSCLSFEILFENLVRSDGFLFGVDFAFHCFPIVKNINATHLYLIPALPQPEWLDYCFRMSLSPPSKRGACLLNPENFT